MREVLELWWKESTTLDSLILWFGGLLMFFHIGTLVYLYLYRHWWKLDPVPTFQRERWRLTLLNLTELLPLLGLLGTVLALLQTFYGVGKSEAPDLQQMFIAFAPALTTTISGLIGAAINILLNAVLGLLEVWLEHDHSGRP